jgi:hypothetical protein
MVCPRSGDFFAIEATHVCSDMFKAFLDEAAATFTLERKRNILILDNATWHTKKSRNLHGVEIFLSTPPIPRISILLNGSGSFSRPPGEYYCL